MCLSVVIVRGILAEVRNRGLEPDELLRASKIDPERISDVRETVTFEEAERLVYTAVKRTMDSGLGLAVGANAPESMLQVFGHLLLAHRTIREAFAALQRYSALIVEDTTFRLFEQGDLAYFTCEPAVKMGPATRFFMDLALAVSARVGYHFTRTRSELHEVHFRHAMPSYASRYREVFECPVLFGQASNALIFPRTLVDRPQLHADDEVRAVLRETAERLMFERAHPRSIGERVRSLLRYEQDLSSIDAGRIARRIGVSRRTLRRKLSVEGTPLSMLLDEARCRVACMELRRSDANVKQTAELLGFSERSAFHRAFKRWTGHTPAEFSRIGGADVEVLKPAPDVLAKGKAERSGTRSRSGSR